MQRYSTQHHLQPSSSIHGSSPHLDHLSAGGNIVSISAAESNRMSSNPALRAPSPSLIPRQFLSPQTTRTRRSAFSETRPNLESISQVESPLQQRQKQTEQNTDSKPTETKYRLSPIPPVSVLPAEPVSEPPPKESTKKTTTAKDFPIPPPVIYDKKQSNSYTRGELLGE
ncbi:hypothetical protein HK096_010044, partial [Nowakowskiella sp. JEL0078]